MLLLQVVFHLDNNHKLCYDDSRCFGMMKLSNELEYKNVKDIGYKGRRGQKLEETMIPNFW